MTASEKKGDESKLKRKSRNEGQKEVKITKRNKRRREFDKEDNF